MFYSLYQNILDFIKEDFEGFNLTDANFGLGPAGEKKPYFTIEEKSFDFKTPLLKKVDGTKLLAYSEKFSVPSQKTKKKGPFLLQAPVPELSSVLIIQNPNTVNETSSSLPESKFKITAKEITLTDEYVGGSELVVSYKSLGKKYTNRFILHFTLKIYEQNQGDLEKYSMLALPAIWTNYEKLIASSYKYAVGNLQTIINPSELSFNGQINGLDNESVNLNYTVSGIATFIKTKIDGELLIKEVKLGDTQTIVNNEKGISIGFIETTK